MESVRLNGLFFGHKFENIPFIWEKGPFNLEEKRPKIVIENKKMNASGYSE